MKDRVKSWQVKQYDLLDLPEYDLNQHWNLKDIYDAAFCLEIFEYIYNPMQAAANLYNLLKTNGRLYLSFHFVYPHHSAKKNDYLRYTRWGVEKLLSEAGFSDWDIYARYFNNSKFIKAFYADEQMKLNIPNHWRLHSEQGYLVRAVK